MEIKVSTIVKENDRIFTDLDIIKLIPSLREKDGSVPTDKKKILFVLAASHIPYEEKGNSLYFSGKRYLFDEETEEIISVFDQKDNL